MSIRTFTCNSAEFSQFIIFSYQSFLCGWGIDTVSYTGRWDTNDWEFASYWTRWRYPIPMSVHRTPSWFGKFAMPQTSFTLERVLLNLTNFVEHVRCWSKARMARPIQIEARRIWIHSKTRNRWIRLRSRGHQKHVRELLLVEGEIRARLLRVSSALGWRGWTGTQLGSTLY